MGTFVVILTTIGIGFFIKTVSEKEETKRRLGFKTHEDRRII